MDSAAPRPAAVLGRDHPLTATGSIQQRSRRLELPGVYPPAPPDNWHYASLRPVTKTLAGPRVLQYS